MATFGKVLAFFNVFAVALVVVFAGMDYGKYRGQAYKAFLHELVDIGLPVDSDQVAESEPGEPLVNRLSEKALADVFAGNDGGSELGGQPVKTVVEELDRVQRKVKENIDKQATDDAKRSKVWAYLEYQVRNIGEREGLRQKCLKGDVNEAIKDLEKLFTYAKQPQNRTEKPSPTELRVAAAQVMLNLSGDEAWRRRVMTVCGMAAYVQAVGSQADSYAQIAADVRDLIVRDQGNFEVAYTNLVRELLYFSEEYYLAEKRLADLKVTLADREREVAARQTDVARHRDELTVKSAATSAEVARLEAMQRDLLAIQQRLGQALDETDRLEQLLKTKAPPQR